MLQALLLLHLAADLGPEITVAPPGPNAPAAGYQYRPAVASDGTDFLVVWIDKRREDGTHSTYGARIRRDGLVLDPVGIPLGALHSDEPRVAYAGSGRYVITWSFDGDVIARILRTDGTWEGPAFTVGPGYCPDVAAAGGSFAVAYYNGEVLARRYLPDAGRLDADPLMLSTALGSSACPRISPGLLADEWTVNWVEPDSVRAAFIRAASAPQPSTLASMLGPGPTLRGLVQLPDRQSWVAWSSDSTGHAPVVAITESPMGLGAPQLVWPSDAGAWETAFATGADGEVRGFVGLGPYSQAGFATVIVPVDGGAPRLGPSGTGYPGGEPSLAASSDRLLLAVSFRDEIAYAVMDQELVTLDAGIVSMSGAGQHQLALAGSGSSWLAVWSENSGSDANVIARRLGSDAMPVGPSQVLSAAGTRARGPSAAFANGTWAVVWEDQSLEDARFQLLTEPGARGASGGLRHNATRGVMPHVVADGPRFAVVFVARGGAEIDFAALETDGGVSSTSRVGAGPNGTPSVPRIARGDGGFLVVWQQNNDIRGARLDALGQSLDPASFAIATGDEVQLEPQVAFDGEAYVVSYRDYVLTRYVRVRGTQVSAPFLPFTPGPAGTLRRTALVSQPGGVLATACDTSEGDVLARVLSPSGDGLDAGPPLEVAAGPQFACEPAVAGVGNVLFGYGRFELTPQAMSAKVKLHRPDPVGAPCAESWRCATGLCRGGVCVLPQGAGGGSGAGGGGAGGASGGSAASGGGSGTGGAGSPSALGIGCGCSSGSGASLLLALLGLAWSRRRSRATT